MSWVLFIDESGNDRQESPYEVHAGLAVDDRDIWNLIQDIQTAQKSLLGEALFEQYGGEIKASTLLKRKTFRHARQQPKMNHKKRQKLIEAFINRGSKDANSSELAAVAQTKIAFAKEALDLCMSYGCKSFASIVPRDAHRPRSSMLRKDYVFLFERFYYFLESQDDKPMGHLVLDEFNKRSCHILIRQMSAYFIKTENGRERSKQIIPEPFLCIAT